MLVASTLKGDVGVAVAGDCEAQEAASFAMSERFLSQDAHDDVDHDDDDADAPDHADTFLHDVSNKVCASVLQRLLDVEGEEDLGRILEAGIQSLPIEWKQQVILGMISVFSATPTSNIKAQRNTSRNSLESACSTGAFAGWFCFCCNAFYEKCTPLIPGSRARVRYPH